MDKKQAVEKWLSEFNFIPQSLLNRAFKDNIEDFMEITQPTVNGQAWSSKLENTVTIVGIEYETGEAMVTDNIDTYIVRLEDLSAYFDEYLPIWGTMFSFKNPFDEDWARENLDKVSRCGFRIYEDTIDSTIYLGVDGGGYDFIDHHWLSLYDARELDWHTEL